MRARPAIVCVLAATLLGMRCLPTHAADSPYFASPDSVIAVSTLDDVCCNLGPFRWWLASHPARAAEVDGFIQTDRPSFTEANTTVPAGWVQLESGYQYTYDRNGGITSRTNNAPELNLRVGLNDWAEMRILWNGVSNVDRTGPGLDLELRDSANMQAGFKLVTTRQDGWVPQSVVITTLFLPTGEGFPTTTNDKSSSFSRNVVPLFDYIYGWSWGPGWSLVGSTGATLDGRRGRFIGEVFQSLVLQRDYSVHWSVYYEAYSLFNYFTDDMRASPYMDGGVLWRPRNNIQFDWRAGFGLNANADDFFTGAGLSFRY
ncbi:MAG: transporter [Planctomycetota bacterium]|nr:MAG: transporter [Planctomycetota bacterium]